MKLILHDRFTDGERIFKVIGFEFHPNPGKNWKVFYEFEEEGTHPPKIRLREVNYINSLLESGKLKCLT